jgi:hypothetical protein
MRDKSGERADNHKAATGGCSEIGPSLNRSSVLSAKQLGTLFYYNEGHEQREEIIIFAIFVVKILYCTWDRIKITTIPQEIKSGIRKVVFVDSKRIFSSLIEIPCRVRVPGIFIICRL